MTIADIGSVIDKLTYAQTKQLECYMGNSITEFEYSSFTGHVTLVGNSSSGVKWVIIIGKDGLISETTTVQKEVKTVQSFMLEPSIKNQLKFEFQKEGLTWGVGIRMLIDGYLNEVTK